MFPAPVLSVQPNIGVTSVVTLKGPPDHAVETTPGVIVPQSLITSTVTLPMLRPVNS